MKNLKIGKKLNLSFLIVLIVSIITIFYAVSNIIHLGDLTNKIFNGPYIVTTEAMGVRREINGVGRCLASEVLSEGKISYRDELQKSLDKAYKRLEIIRENYDGDESQVDAMENTVNKLKKEVELTYSLLDKGDIAGAKANLNSDSYKQVFYDSSKQSVALYDTAENSGDLFHKEINKTIKNVAIIAIILGLGSIAIGLLMALYITKSLKDPIKEIEIATNKMAEGNFDINVTYESKDELGSLAESIRAMSNNINLVTNDTVRVLSEVASGNFNVTTDVEYIGVFNNIKLSLGNITSDLSTTMEQINLASEEVEAAADQFASESQILSQGATEQASSIEELSATISEISEKINNTANNAKEANELTLSSGQEVKQGNKQMSEMVKAMEEISLASNEISRILKTIDDIAFQTNILALNAAVEAARAGEAGKGFAVVADEVRNLAAKSAEASKNTANLIENSIKAVENGSEIMNNTVESLQRIIDKTNETISIVDTIARESSEQAIAVNQVTLGIEEISSIVQTNSASFEESAATSEELNNQSKMLKSLIGSFTLKK